MYTVIERTHKGIAHCPVCIHNTPPYILNVCPKQTFYVWKNESICVELTRLSFE